jgi:hypothetical protein
VTRARTNTLASAARFAAALAAFGLVSGYLTWFHQWRLAAWVVRAGQAFGMDVTQVSGKYVAPRPFDGVGFWPAAWNAAFALAPPLLCAIAAWLAAAATFAACGGLGPLRRFRDGRTRCGHCGYILSGLREPRCPECGRAI